MKKILFLLLSIYCCKNSFAQLDFDWANKIKNEQGGNDFAQALTSDAAGNVLVTGVFSGTADLIYGADTALVSSNGGLDIYMAKFDTSGNLLWKKTMGGPLDDYTYSIKTDSNGDIYISGTCSENADFDGGDDTTLIQINGPSNSGIIFLAKYSSLGDLIWVKGMSSANGFGLGKDIEFAANGDVILAGNFKVTVDFDPSPAVLNFSAISTNYYDIFITRFTSNGDLVWAKQIGGNNYDEVKGMAIDASDNIYLTGYFMSTVDFDPGPAVTSFTAPVNRKLFYLAKYSGLGDLVWVNYNPQNESEGGDIALESSGNLVVTGFFNVQFSIANAGNTFYEFVNTGNRTFVFRVTPSDSILWGDSYATIGNLSIASGRAGDIYISGYSNTNVWGISLNKISASGSLAWSQQMINTNDASSSQVCFTANNKIVHVGYYSNAIDFDPSPANNSLGSISQNSGFIAAYNESNGLVWLNGVRDDNTSYIINEKVIENDYSGNILVGGSFQGNINANPTSNSMISLPASRIASYMVKYSPSGEHLWMNYVRGSGSCAVKAMTFDKNNNLYVAGSFSLKAFFDPNGLNDTLTASGSDDIYIAKFDSLGNYKWAFNIGGNSATSGYDLAVKLKCVNDRIYLIGNFFGTVDFNPSATSNTLVSVGGVNDFVACYDTTGAYVFAYPFLGKLTDLHKSKSNHLLLCGTFNGTRDLDFGPAVYNVAPPNTTGAFVARYDAQFNFVWATRIDGGPASPQQIRTDSLDNSYLVATSQSITNFYSTNSTFLTSGTFNTPLSYYFFKYDSVGIVQWVKSTVKSTTNEIVDIELDRLGNIYMVANFANTLDVDFDNGVVSLSPFSSSNADMYIACYTANGDFSYVKSNPTFGIELVNDLAIFDNNLSFYFTGGYSDGYNVNYAGIDKFISGRYLVNYNLSCLNAAQIISTSNASNCGPGSLTLAATASSGSINWYNTASSSTILFTGNSFTTPVLAASKTYYVEAAASTCNLARVPVTASIIAIPTITANNYVSCQPASFSLNAIPSAGTVNWYTNASGGTLVGSGVPYVTPFLTATTTYYAEADNNGCLSATRIPVTASVNSAPVATLTLTDSTFTATPAGLSYQWLNCATDTVISNAFSNIYTPTVSGTYAAIVSQNGCADTTVCIPIQLATLACGELFISEYLEGTSNTKAIEIYNPSSASVSLSGYSLELYANGTSTATNTLNLTGTLAAFDVYVVANSQSTAPVLAAADITSAVCAFNGNDAIALKHNGNVIDVVGEIGVNPGTSWTVGAGSTLDYTLVRNASVDGPSNLWTSVQSQWIINPVNTVSNLGSHTSNCQSGNGLITAHSELSGITIRPNPASELLQIKLTDHELAEFELIDLTGSCVLKMKVFEGINTIHLPELPSGLYLVKAVTGQGTYYTKVVISN
ncbi:MAG TPA: lamin tail domain-containing protein [Bacteroidia bacterium]|nr:lamin tail domain-containing protein [Bacteroidia bacterium]HRH07191.1 lamin tail domain-containing protein [Bacteroidia bacterium]